MTVPECPREQDVINAIVSARWPHHCDETLQTHASECGVCKELIEVASVLRLEGDGLHDEMSVPSAGQVWWRAAIRATPAAGHVADTRLRAAWQIAASQRAKAQASCVSSASRAWFRWIRGLR